MPNDNHNYAPDLELISSFFGTSQNADRGWSFNNAEKMPDNWTMPYNNVDVTLEILAQYTLHPVLFSGKTSNGSFDALPSLDLSRVSGLGP